jgi:CheY-like chemotaxis protein
LTGIKSSISWVIKGLPCLVDAHQRNFTGWEDKSLGAATERALSKARVQWSEVAMSELNARDARGDLEGFRVLIVEDDRFVAEDEGYWLKQMGCVVLGPLPSVAEALAVLESDLPDGAVLDIEVCGTAIYPVARLLAAHRVPFLFVSASHPDSIDENFRSVPRLMKPIGEYQLQRAALQVFKAQGSSASRRTNH